VRSKEELITEEKVEGLILERVMKRLEGRHTEEDTQETMALEEKQRLAA